MTPEGRFRFAAKHPFLLAASWFALALAGLALAALPFRTIVQRLGGPASARRKWFATDEAARAIGMASRLTPGSTCLSRALALQVLLQLGGTRSTVWIGVARPPDADFHAHAWLEAEGRIVLGKPLGETFTPLTAFGERR